MGRVLIVDDERGIRDVLEVLVSKEGHAVTLAASVDEAVRHMGSEVFDLVITDLRLEPDGDGIDVIVASRRMTPPPEVIVMTAFGTRERAQRAISEGASFYLEKGPHFAADMRVLVAQATNKRRLQAENEQLRRELVEKYSVGGIVGKSPLMREVLDIVDRVASLKATVLVTGESGTGKERIAKALHYGSAQRTGPFIAVNCGAIPENLIESELFGHKKGAFTGADEDREGLFAAARNGTLFLDEVGELPLTLQPKLLRALQERKVKALGAVEETDVDVRIIGATNRDLEEEVASGRFREDLFFRLNVVQIDLPPLRQRREDIPLLAETFREKYAREYERDVKSIDAQALERLLSFHNPGNIRQLENVIERAVALSTGPVLTLRQLPSEIASAESVPTRVFNVATDAPFPDEGIDLERMLEDFEYRLISTALEKAGGVKTKAAELLGVSFRQFRYKLGKYEKRKG
ncbi:MAG: sigma-54 dependent transcriptional regulator [Deltaproteobacteria bacterium]